MGWTGGSYVMQGIIEAANKIEMDSEMRYRLYKEVLPVLEEQDWDCVEEVLELDSEYDRLFVELHPDYFEEDEDGEE